MSSDAPTAAAAAAAAAAEEDWEPHTNWFKSVDETTGSRKPDPIVVFDNVVRRFGGLTAVSVDHLEVQRGAITALIGPNGAGKTTLFNLATGFDRADGGTWTLNGTNLQRRPSYRIARMGMVRTFQLTKVMARMTVIENMKLGAGHQVGERFIPALLRRPWTSQEQEIEERADRLLERFNLIGLRGDFAGELSGGQRKLLEMARALMSDPEILLLDEPMAGVNPALAETITHHIHELQSEGLTILFVEHDMDLVRAISDWVVVMGEGQVVAEGVHDSIVANPDVIAAYLGIS